MQVRVPSRILAVVVHVALAGVVVATPAGAATVACQRAMAKASAALVQVRAKALAKCHDTIVKTGAGSCPDAAATKAITKATDKLTAQIDRACGGEDDVCGGDLTGEDTPASLGWPLACPNFERGACDQPLGDCGDIAACLTCVDGAAVDQAITLTYDDLALPSTGDLNRCQRAIGKATSAFLAAKSKALRRCWDARLRGVHSGSCVPPDAGDGKYLAAIAKAEDKQRNTICKACGGADNACGGGDDLAPAAIGFAASCPDVTVPGGAACGGPVADLQDLVECVACTAAFKGDCTDRLSLPGLVPYPAECNECLLTPSGPCPTRLQIEADGLISDLDLGFTGLGHDAALTVPSRVTLGLSGCTGASHPTCGDCNVSGPVANAGGAAFDNHRCRDASWIACSADSDCTDAGATGPCVYLYGPPMSTVVGGIPICLVHEIDGSVTGTVNVESADSAIRMPLRTRIHPAGFIAAPCPVCAAGVCDAGPRGGEACTTSGTSTFGDVSYDCPPSDGSLAGEIRYAPLRSTGVQTMTVSADNPACRQTGYTSRRCLCDTCNNLAAEPCSTNADCPPSGGNPGVCGGRRCIGGANAGEPCGNNSECPAGACQRPGEPTQPNVCQDLTAMPGDGTLCMDLGNGEGECPEGPAEAVCSIETYRGCLGDADCNPPPFPGSTCPDCVPGQTCIGRRRPCFPANGSIGDSVTVAGSTGSVTEAFCAAEADVVTGALFCVQPRLSNIFPGPSAINTIYGLPGLGKLVSSETMTILP